MDRQEMVARLAGLREAVEREGEVRLSALETTFALALWDVCGALGLTAEERSEVLGEAAIADIDAALGVQVWVVEGPAKVAAQ